MKTITRDDLNQLRQQGAVYHLVIDHQQYFRDRDMHTPERKQGFDALSDTLTHFHSELTALNVPTVNVMTRSASQENLRNAEKGAELEFYYDPETLTLSREKNAPAGKKESLLLKNVDFIQTGFESQFTYVKTVNDAFGNDGELDKFLKKKQVKTLVVSGLYRDLCVDATVKSAMKKGYNVVLALDAIDDKKASTDIQQRFAESARHFSEKIGGNKRAYAAKSSDIVALFQQTKDDIIPPKPASSGLVATMRSLFQKKT